jgi:ABC-type uncharacterized transport system substrate-binding protein
MAGLGMIWTLLPALLAAATALEVNASILVAVESGIEAYDEAIKGMDAFLGSNGYRRVDLRPGAPELDKALASPSLRVIVAIGSRALAELNARRPTVPVVATMVLQSPREPGYSGVTLEIPLTAQLQAVRTMWPRRLRVGILRNPARSRFSADTLAALARKEGFTPIVVDCEDPARLLKTVAELKSTADFLLCFPDPQLYDAVTIKPFVLASLEARLPILGFSPAFVRAGAAAGIYPDYREIGRQTAEMVLRRLRGDGRVADECPRKLRIAVNQRVLRLLGADYETAGLPVVVFR